MTTRAKWSEILISFHINVLELIAAELGILTFTKEQSNIGIHLQIDSKTTPSYLLKMGVHTTENYCRSVNPFGITFSHQTNYTVCRIPSQCSEYTGIHANWELRNVEDNSEWKLGVSNFQEIATHVGQLTLDLFASRLCHQRP